MIKYILITSLILLLSLPVFSQPEIPEIINLSIDGGLLLLILSAVFYGGVKLKRENKNQST